MKQNLPTKSLLRACLLALWATVGMSKSHAETQTHWKEFKTEIEPLLETYCYDCHADGIKKGEMSFDEFNDHPSMIANRKQWTKIQNNIRHSIMPPADEDSPNVEEKKKILSWIEKSIFHVDPDNPDPGRITVRRLNRAQFQNSIMHLTGVRYDLSETLPQDDSGYGFNNIADVLTLSPLHIEQYLHVAQIVTKLGKDQYMFAERQSTDSDIQFAKNSITRLAENGFRRPVTHDEVKRLMAFYTESRSLGMGVKEAIRQTCIPIITSPNFLFLELDNLNQKTNKTSNISEITLASRISYFLRGSIPDSRLLKLAKEGQLRKNLTSEVDRLLADKHNQQHLAETFFSQWLRTDNVKLAFRHPKHHGNFSGNRRLFSEESIHFFKHIVRENRPVIEIINANYSYANEKVAKHYGIHDVKGKKFQKIPLTGLPRRGILTHTSVLTSTAHPDSTSPVNRGKWVLEALLDQAPPPPPPNVADLNPPKELKHASIRQQLEAHRADPACSSCHKMMDGIGFAFERYDNIGRWINSTESLEIDTSGSLHTGEEFADLNELIDLLVHEKKDDFIRCMSKKLLTFALGRGTEYYDKTALNNITAKVNKDPRMHTMIHAVIQSTPFQMTRGIKRDTQL